jgi:glucose/arabinose dehydrogenase
LKTKLQVLERERAKKTKQKKKKKNKEVVASGVREQLAKNNKWL